MKSACEVIVALLIICLTFYGCVNALTQPERELRHFKAEAVRRGFAHYTNDLNGNSTFVWREK